ncbi:vesicular glutamate transporter 2 [Elysia marginata]|uniref:Vesicular glutamate transporter 2 n=1 Tax=Elysia marginata TaxID=1093978 RepID=A0AAV4ID42_9GAST|nr:vesicular glutamate transporter 2 [Elysia marginata]
MDNSGYIPDHEEKNRRDNVSHDTKKAVDFKTDESKTWTSDKPPPLLGSSRLALSLIACVGFLNLYALRVNLSVAMVCMVNQTALDLIKDGGVSVADKRPATCNGVEDESSNNTNSGDKDGEFVWSKEIQGYVLGSFFWGYMLTQVFGGWLAAR